MRDLDELKSAWHSQPGIAPERFNQMATAVHENTASLQTTILHRDMAETFASLVLGVFGMIGLVNAKNWMDLTGFVLLVAIGLMIPAVLWWARRRSLNIASAANFCDFVDVEIDFLRRQSRLLRNVTWWYLLPFYISGVLICVGHTTPRPGVAAKGFLVVYLTACAVFFLYIRHLNQSARKKVMVPLLDYYTGLREAIERGDEFSAEYPGPPNVLGEARPRKPLSRRQRLVRSILVVVATVSVVVLGFQISARFDERTGYFVMSTAPAIAILVIVLSGVLRRSER